MSLYVSVLLIVCYLLVRFRSEHSRMLMSFYLIVISVMAFLYTPDFTADLYRLLEYMGVYASKTNDEFLQSLAASNTPVTLIYYRFIGSFELPGLLAGITTFLVFLNIFYILFDYAKRLKLKLSKKALALTLFTVMSTGIYMQTVGGIRTMLAFSIIARCFYDESVNGKRGYVRLLWYVLACLIHPAAIVAVGIRFFAFVWGQARDGKTRSLLSIAACLPIGAYLAYKLGGGLLIESVLTKAEGYIQGNPYNYIWDNILTILTIGLILINYRLYSYFKGLGQVDEKLKYMVRFSWMLTIFALLLSFEHATFVRFTQLNLIVIIPLLITNYTILQSTKNKLPRLAIAYGRLMLLTAIAMLIISASRGALSSLKFFVIN